MKGVWGGDWSLSLDRTCGQWWESWIPWGQGVTQGRRGEGGAMGRRGGLMGERRDEGGRWGEGHGVHWGRRGEGGLRKTAWFEKLNPVENCLRVASMSKADLGCCHKREENFLHHSNNHCLDLRWKVGSAASFSFECSANLIFSEKTSYLDRALILLVQCSVTTSGSTVDSQPQEMLFQLPVFGRSCATAWDILLQVASYVPNLLDFGLSSHSNFQTV